MAQVNVDTITAAYIKLRDRRSELKKAYDQEDGELKSKMERLETWLMGKMQENNATQLGSAHGTAYLQTQYKASCSDWPTFWGFVSDNGRFDMLEKRVASKAINEFIEETGDTPPGINVSAELKVVIRRT